MKHPLVEFLNVMHPFTPEEGQLVADAFETILPGFYDNSIFITKCNICVR